MIRSSLANMASHKRTRVPIIFKNHRGSYPLGSSHDFSNPRRRRKPTRFGSRPDLPPFYINPKDPKKSPELGLCSYFFSLPSLYLDIIII